MSKIYYKFIIHKIYEGDEQMNDNDNYIQKLNKLLEKEKNLELVKLIKKLIEERNYFRRVANIDTLTGLYNRRILNQIEISTGVLMIDIDNFKRIYDQYNHNVGDIAIKEVSQIIKKHIRSVDYICRFGGDEFVIVFIECPSSIIIERAETIRRKIQDSINIESQEITVSIGVSINTNDLNIEQLILAADSALYQAKNNGKNQIKLYNDKIKKLEKK